MPPRTTARGARAAPLKAAISGVVPYVHANPSRGLTTARLGSAVLEILNRRLTSALAAGESTKWFMSSRAPYVIWRSCVGRYASPSATLPSHSPSCELIVDNCRVNDASRPAARSASELNVKVPSVFDPWSASYPSRRRSVVNFTRCLLSSLNHDSWFVASSTVVVDRNSVDAPPNNTGVTPPVPSSNVEATKTRPDGRSRYGVENRRAADAERPLSLRTKP